MGIKASKKIEVTVVALASDCCGRVAVQQQLTSLPYPQSIEPGPSLWPATVSHSAKF